MQTTHARKGWMGSRAPQPFGGGCRVHAGRAALAMEARWAAPRLATSASRGRLSVSPMRARPDGHVLRQASSPLRRPAAPSHPGPARMSSSPQGAPHPAPNGVALGGGLAAVVCWPGQHPAPLEVPPAAQAAPHAAASPARLHSPVRRAAAVRAIQVPVRQVSLGQPPVRQMARTESQAHMERRRPEVQTPQSAPQPPVRQLARTESQAHLERRRPQVQTPQPAPAAASEHASWPSKPTSSASVLAPNGRGLAAAGVARAPRRARQLVRRGAAARRRGRGRGGPPVQDLGARGVGSAEPGATRPTSGTRARRRPPQAAPPRTSRGAPLRRKQARLGPRRGRRLQRFQIAPTASSSRRHGACCAGLWPQSSWTG
ncbi:unnamed protein product [Prorocentrum cordatum]|uniref:Uncharacterized protein n=1 Tax=Prorocentrum cordatum TaxID=2364126 RepID=A0ABN9VB87_9DINO|nr:unnamed protein product [Polarella glacialis]